MEPIASKAWLPLATRPSSQTTATPPSFTVDGLGPGPLEQPNPPAQQLVLQGGGHLGILAGQHLLAADDQGHLGAERAEHVHELHPGHPRADHDQVLGHGGRRVGLPGGEDALPIGLGPVRNARPAAGRDEDGVGVELLDAVVGLGHHLVRRP